MSILKEDYYRENKSKYSRSKYHGGVALSKKITVPTQHRSTKHKCSQCTRTDAKKYSISDREVRWLCIKCINRNKNKDAKEKPNFVKASKLRINNVC